MFGGGVDARAHVGEHVEHVEQDEHTNALHTSTAASKRLLYSDASSTTSQQSDMPANDLWDSAIVFHFEDKCSEATFYALISTLNILALCFIICMSCSICSSYYTMRESMLDPIMLMLDIFLVDVSSAFFVVSGFTCAFIYSSIGVQAFRTFRMQMHVFIFIDLYLSGLCSILIGSITALLKHEFKFQDVAFTLFEQCTALRLFDVKQSLQAFHNMNVGSWPVQCFVWCLMTVHMTYSGNNLFRSKFGSMGSHAIMVSAVCGIVLFTLFGMLHNKSNIFYANATNFTYRTLEFNLGIHFFYLLNMNESIATTLMRFVHQSSRGVLFLFICIWWSEIGSSYNANLVSDTSSADTSNSSHASNSTQVCLRMYPKNQCLRDHHAFLLRGCCLGITLISTFAYEHAGAYNSNYTHVMQKKSLLTFARVYSSAVAFCWPAYQTIQLIFQITFSEELIARNMALMSVLQPMFLVAGALVYSLFIKPHVSFYAEKEFSVAHAYALALWKKLKTGEQASAHSISSRQDDVDDNLSQISDIDDLENITALNN